MTGRRRSRRFAAWPTGRLGSEAGHLRSRRRSASVRYERTAELLLPVVDRVHWYCLFDLPSSWTATTRHKEAEGSAYYRHYYMDWYEKTVVPNQRLHVSTRPGNLPVVPL